MMGHYYAFIYDRCTHEWYRFNDYQVTLETEDKVLEEGFGGSQRPTCAYGLIYVNQEIAKTQTLTNINDFN